MALAFAAFLPEAHAAGIEVGVNGSRATSRGGAFVVRADDATALDHNPGGLSRLHGTHLTLSHNSVNARLRFTRAESVVAQTPYSDPGSPDPFAPVQNEAPWYARGIMMLAATDFGLRDFTFAVGVYGPSSVGRKRFDVRGGQRWLLTEIDALIAYYSAAVAYGRETWGVGVTLQLAHQRHVAMSLVTDGTAGSTQSPYYSATDVLTRLELAASPTFTAIVGAWWRPIPALEVAVSGRVIPARLRSTGTVTLQNTPGGSQFGPDQLGIDNGSAALTMTIPPTAKVGARYRHLAGEREVFDVELDLVYEMWSMLDAYRVDLEGDIKLFAATPARDVVIAKNWQDTVAVRLGGTWAVRPGLGLSLGTFYESAAVPVNYSHLDFLSFARLGLGTGVQLRLASVDLSLAYLHVLQESRVVDERYAKVYQQRPVTPCPCDGYGPLPANAGRFESGYSTISVSASYSF